MNQITPKTTLSERTPSPMGWLRGEIDRLFDDLGGTRSLFDFGPRSFSLAPNPAIEMKEGDKDYRLTAELPGLSEKDVTIDLTDDMLTISGEKKEDQERKSDGYVLSERRYGAFRRQITIPNDVEPAKIEARFANGVLTIVMPKDGKTATRTRRIEIAS